MSGESDHAQLFSSHLEREEENRNLIRHLKQVLCALLQKDYVLSILKYIQSCIRKASHYDSRYLPSVVEELQAAALSLSSLFSLVQVGSPTTSHAQMTQSQAQVLQATLSLVRDAAPAFQPLASVMHSTLLQPFFFPANFTQAISPAFTQGELLSSELLAQHLRQLRDARSADLLFALSLAALRMNAPEAADALRAVTAPARPHT